jgi:hypothetical protein
VQASFFYCILHCWCRLAVLLVRWILHHQPATVATRTLTHILGISKLQENMKGDAAHSLFFHFPLLLGALPAVTPAHCTAATDMFWVLTLLERSTVQTPLELDEHSWLCHNIPT